jgi:hypothetical protein
MLCSLCKAHVNSAVIQWWESIVEGGQKIDTKNISGNHSIRTCTIFFSDFVIPGQAEKAKTFSKFGMKHMKCLDKRSAASSFLFIYTP